MRWITCIVIGAIMGACALAAWNRMPEEWLCDYGEGAAELKNGKNLEACPWSLLFTAGFTACTAVCAAYAESWANAALVLLSLWLLLLLFLSDLRFMIIPDQLTIGIAAVGALFGVLELFRGEALLSVLWQRAAGGVGCGGLFLVLGGVSSLVTGAFEGRGRKKAEETETKETDVCAEIVKARAGADAEAEDVRGFGMGDVKLLFALGVLLGPAGGLTALAAASILCGAAVAVLLAAGRVTVRQPHPFGPYLCAAAAAILLSK